MSALTAPTPASPSAAARSPTRRPLMSTPARSKPLTRAVPTAQMQEEQKAAPLNREVSAGRGQQAAHARVMQWRMHLVRQSYL